MVGGITDSMNQSLLSGPKEGLPAALKNKGYPYPTSVPVVGEKRDKGETLRRDSKFN